MLLESESQNLMLEKKIALDLPIRIMNALKTTMGGGGGREGPN